MESELSWILGQLYCWELCVCVGGGSPPTPELELLPEFFTSLGKCLFKSFDHLKQFFFFFCWVVVLYILDINPFSDIWFANIFSHSVSCLLSLDSHLWCTKWSPVNFFLLFAVFLFLVSYSRNHCQVQCHKDFPQSFILREL